MSDEWRASQPEKLAEVEREIDRHTEPLEGGPGTGRELRALTPVTGPSWPISFEVPGRCGEGSFSRDGRELAIASGFEETNVSPDGEVAGYGTRSGAGGSKWLFSAYRAVVVPTWDGQYVHSWHSDGGRLRAGDLTWWEASGQRRVLATGLKINSMIVTLLGCAGVTSNGDLLLMNGAEVSRARRNIPVHGLACDPETGKLAAVGHGLVLMDYSGRVLVKARKVVADHVAFLGTHRLVTLDAGGNATIWLHEGRGRLVRGASIDGPRNANRLIALPQHNAVLAPNRYTGQTSLIWADGQALRMIHPPTAVHGHDAWGSFDGRLLAVTRPVNRFLPPAPARVDIFPTEMLLEGG